MRAIRRYWQGSFPESGTAGRVPRSSRIAGFTLVEIMIAVVIVAVLAAIAYPVYTSYVRSSRRTAAINALQRAATAEEKYYATYNVYASSLASLDYTSNAVKVPSDTEYWYKLSASLDSDGGYVLKAEPVNSQQDDSCGTFQLTSTGSKTVTGSKTESQCWGSG